MRDRFRLHHVGLLLVLLLVTAGLTADQLQAQPRLTSTASRDDGGGPDVGFSLITNQLDDPVGLAHAGDERLFVIEQAGVIRIIENGSLLGDPFLDINDRVACCGERGLLGLAFSPDYESSGEFYVNYTYNNSGTWSRVARYHVTSDPNVASRTEEVVLDVRQDSTNHNGGDMHFGPDGYLYIGFGDGGGQGDPNNRGQDGAQLLGKILRIDVVGQTTYAVPANNPYVGDPDVRDEIWALGLRNPWRWSFDRITGAMWIGDVGQSSWEEINYVPRTSSGARNYGWNCFEGTGPYGSPGPLCTLPFTHTPPVHEYPRSAGHSVTGGYVYRGTDYPRLGGYYFFGDFSFSKLWTLNPDGSGGWNVIEHSPSIVNPSAFGEGYDGELYAISYSGALFKITESSGTTGITPRVYLPVATTE